MSRKRVKLGISKITVIVLIIVVVIIALIGGTLVFYHSSSSSIKTTQSSIVPISTTPVTIGALQGNDPDISAWAFTESQLLSTLKEYDPNIKTQDFSTATLVIQGLESGTIQVGIISTDSIIVAISRGAPLVIVATYRITPAARDLVVKASTPINNLYQLNNTDDAEPSPGILPTITDEYLEYKYNLHFNFEYVGSFQGQIAALISDKATFANVNPFDAYKLIQNGTLKVVYSFSLKWPAYSVVTTRSFLEQHPDAIKAVIMGLLKANDIYEANVNNQTINFLASYYGRIIGSNGAVVLFHNYTYSTNGAINVTALQILINTYREIGVITNSTLTVNDTYTNEFVKVIS
ncbi:MAG: ABC transporter substrate-binding protein [Saccharolobus sp.]|uniref:ABC transporter substrate-binding protein n=1 Tax=Saccharolobus TaxID=2100760 RepID=UPI001F1172A5|nr:ABC transporter substrate-binding protein [Saccharolobus shibatae]MCH4815811.1 ABC transporter substrate-binding protein [Saccharolobus shibatae]